MTSQTEAHFDPIPAEQTELDNLIEKGIVFRTRKQSLLRFFGSPERKFYLFQPFLGTLDYLSREWLKMDYSEAVLQEESINEAKRLVHHNARRCARIVAIAYLNRQWKIKLLTPFYTRYFLWRLTPEKLIQLSLLIQQISNLGDFINSIRLLSIQKRTTAPALMEKPEKPVD